MVNIFLAFCDNYCVGSRSTSTAYPQYLFIRDAVPDRTSLLSPLGVFFLLSIVLLTVRLFTPCVTLCCCLCRTALLNLGPVAVVNENLFSTGLPG